MTLPDEKIRRLLEITWDVATETTFRARMALLSAALDELIPADARVATAFDPATVGAARASGSLVPVERPFDLAPERHLYLENYSLDVAIQYATRFLQFDPLTPRALANPGTPLKLSQVVGPKLWGNEPYTRDFIPLTGFKHMLGTVVPVTDDVFVSLGNWRRPDRRDFSKTEVRLLKLLQPIVARATLAALLSEKLAAPAPDASKQPHAGFALFARSGEPIRADAGARAFLARLESVPHAMDKIAAEVLSLASSPASDGSAERTFPLEHAAIRVFLTRVGADGAVAAIFQELTFGPDPAFGAAAARFGLSARECEVARRVIDGRANKEIAAALRVSLETVKTHLKNIFRKAGVETRTELAAKLLANGSRPQR